MKAVWIDPSDIGCNSEYSTDWINFCKALGYTENNIPFRVLLCNIETN